MVIWNNLLVHSIVDKVDCQVSQRESFPLACQESAAVKQWVVLWNLSCWFVVGFRRGVVEFSYLPFLEEVYPIGSLPGSWKLICISHAYYICPRHQSIQVTEESLITAATPASLWQEGWSSWRLVAVWNSLLFGNFIIKRKKGDSGSSYYFSDTIF